MRKIHIFSVVFPLFSWVISCSISFERDEDFFSFDGKPSVKKMHCTLNGMKQFDVDFGLMNGVGN
jgi:hypothetical protein